MTTPTPPDTILLRIRREDLSILLEAIENEIELIDENDMVEAMEAGMFARHRTPEVQVKMDRLQFMANSIIAMSPLKRE